MLYLHIPYCRTACTYCDFHFSINHSNIGNMVDAMCKEMEMRSGFLDRHFPIETIYLGGGTPSLLSDSNLNKLFDSIFKNFNIAGSFECTLEANPDDLTAEKLREIRKSKVNRLSIGVQSFFDDELKLMNRAHDSDQARRSILNAVDSGFENITIDLIYGIPGSGLVRWANNLETAFSLPVKHLSCYGLTIETGTMLQKQISQGKVAPASEEAFSEQFGYLMDAALSNGFEHYEISNFAKPGFRSMHNSRYWNDTPYIGIGPSAHSYNRKSRQWNVSSNSNYIQSMAKGDLPCTIEELSTRDRYNEYVMTRLRTIEGVDIDRLNELFGESFVEHFLINVASFLNGGFVCRIENQFRLTRSGQYIADRIASDLFAV